MNFVVKYFHQILIISLMAFCLVLFYQVGNLKKQIASTKIQNLDQDSKGKQHKIDYLKKEINVYIKSSDSLVMLRKYDSIALAKIRAENDRLKNGLHEKYTAITRMSGHQLFDFFAKLDTGSIEGK